MKTQKVIALLLVVLLAGVAALAIQHRQTLKQKERILYLRGVIESYAALRKYNTKLKDDYICIRKTHPLYDLQVFLHADAAGRYYCGPFWESEGGVWTDGGMFIDAVRRYGKDQRNKAEGIGTIKGLE